MPYAEGRAFYDADAHVMELPDWVSSYAEPRYRDAIPAFSLGTSGLPQRVEEMIERGKRRAGDPAERAAHEMELMVRKGWDAYGAFHPGDRRRALDQLGFRAQLVFSTFGAWQSEAAPNADVSYAVSRALTRAMIDFCSGDPRLLPVTFVPLSIPDKAYEETRFAIEHGIKGITISPLPPETHSITHPALHPVYAALQEAGVPLFFHVEGDAPRKVSPGFANNGWKGQTDFHGGGENFTGLLYMAVSQWVEIALSAMIFDQVLEKFPRLKIGVIELGAVWVPAWLERLEIVKDTFGRTESRIRDLPLRPTDYVKRQMRFTPYPTEDVGRLMELTGSDLYLFSSDYPHVEGGRNPLKRFEQSLSERSDAEKQAFYADNFLDLMGPALPASSQ